MKSIMQKNKECYICGKTYGLEKHHVIFGNSNRKWSDKYGLTVWLCGETCHRNGPQAPHRNRISDLKLKQDAQRAFESRFGDREKFREIFGKSYL